MPSENPFEVGDPFLKVPEVAARLDVTAQTIRNWIDQGILPALRVGRGFRVNPREVDRMVQAGLPLCASVADAAVFGSLRRRGSIATEIRSRFAVRDAGAGR